MGSTLVHVDAPCNSLPTIPQGIVLDPPDSPPRVLGDAPMGTCHPGPNMMMIFLIGFQTFLQARKNILAAYQGGREPTVML
jgi:hypothetical protein